MPLYEVDYCFKEPKYDVINITAKDVDDAERVALDTLSNTLASEIDEVSIEAIRELPQNG